MDTIDHLEAALKQRAAAERGYHECRYEYSHHKTLASAEAALEDMFATGDVVAGERPKIEFHRNRQAGRQYVITLFYTYWA